jgi:hypothetical protein
LMRYPKEICRVTTFELTCKLGCLLKLRTRRHRFDFYWNRLSRVLAACLLPSINVMLK